MTRLTLTALAALTLAPAAPAQPAAFRWQAGQVLTYRVTQTTAAAETTPDGRAETVTTLDLVKRWQVTAVEPAGGATLQMSVVALKLVTRKPDGSTVTYDSAKPESSTPELAQEMGKYVGVPLTVVRLGARGQLAEVRENRFGPGSRLEADLPFKLVLPESDLAPGRAWERTYAVRLDPPQGTGEGHAAVQKYACTAAAGPLATVTMTTALAAPPAAAEQVPLLPLMQDGTLVFDMAAGRLKSARLKVTREVKGHQGQGTAYSFTSDSTEELLEP